MKLSDYVIGFLQDLGIKDVFYLPGGGAMHLDNSLGLNKNINAVCMLHEQAAAIAAEAYARICSDYGACLVTSGPGSTNTVTGLAGAWLDSTPVIFISGQVKRADLVGNQKIRQFGIQEVDIISIVEHITKYAVQIKKPEEIRFELEKAAFVAKSGRPGPVWIDIPLDIQCSDIAVNSLRGYSADAIDFSVSDCDISAAVDVFANSKRPAVILGNGVRLSGAADIVGEFVNKLNCPVFTTWNGADLIEDSNPLYFGRPGAVGQRYANIIQQKADCVISIGTRLNLLSTGFEFDSFLRNAKHIMVDIDENELKKKSVHPFLPICADAKDFMLRFMAELNKAQSPDKAQWLELCRKIKADFPLFMPEQLPAEGYISTYDLVNEVTSQMTGDDIYQFTSSGTAADIAMQTFRFKKGQRGFLTKGLASMGFDLPASIGSCIASGGKRVVCVTGDGGFMMNIQELAVLNSLNLPVKIFVVANNGYGMIYNSQYSNFSKNLTGCTADSGLAIPDINSIAKAFGVHVHDISDAALLRETVGEVLSSNGPAVCTVRVDIAQKILPRQTNYVREDGQMASRPLEDMSPLLNRDMLNRYMDL